MVIGKGAKMWVRPMNPADRRAELVKRLAKAKPKAKRS
jgi:hypothetical protein